MSSISDDFCELLDTYSGRDKVVRLACYTFKLYGCIKENKGWQTAGSKLSNARMMLRLFDDIPTIKGTLSYGLGRHESSSTAAALGVLGNLVDQVFLPVEKVLWLHEVGVLKLTDKNADSLDIASTVLWALGLLISFIQTMRSLSHLGWRRECLQKSTEDKSPEARKDLDTRFNLQTVTAVKLCLDITHAVSCLPHGWLWGERIGSTKVAAIATTSSLIGIGLYFAKKRMLK